MLVSTIHLRCGRKNQINRANDYAAGADGAPTLMLLGTKNTWVNHEFFFFLNYFFAINQTRKHVQQITDKMLIGLLMVFVGKIRSTGVTK